MTAVERDQHIQHQVRNGLYYLKEHAFVEAAEDGLDIYDVEYAILTGKIRTRWRREAKYEVIGPALDDRMIGVVRRITPTQKIRIITVYEDEPLR